MAILNEKDKSIDFEKGNDDLLRKLQTHSSKNKTKKKLLKDWRSLKESFTNFDWCIYENHFLNLENFIHPGGNCIIKQIIGFIKNFCRKLRYKKGREISRYIYGGHSLETFDMDPFIHSSVAFNLIRERSLGEIINKLNKVDSKNWKIKSMEQISSSLFKFNFVCDDKTLTTKNLIDNDFGKYFSIRVVSNNSSKRLYTQIKSQSPGKLIISESISDYFWNKIKGKSFVYPSLSDNNREDLSQISFIIKKYKNENSFTNLIINNKNNFFEVAGPFGTGINIENGSIAIFCCTTGILPFLDFFELYLRKLMNQVFIERMGKNEQMNFLNEDFEKISLNLSIRLFYAVEEEKEFEYFKILRNLQEISKIRGQKNFEIILRLPKGLKVEGVEYTNDYFDLNFIQKKLDLKNINEVYICGSRQMNKVLSEGLITSGFNEANIFIL